MAPCSGLFYQSTILCGTELRRKPIKGSSFKILPSSRATHLVFSESLQQAGVLPYNVLFSFICVCLEKVLIDPVPVFHTRFRSMSCSIIVFLAIVPASVYSGFQVRLIVLSTSRSLAAWFSNKKTADCVLWNLPSIVLHQLWYISNLQLPAELCSLLWRPGRRIQQRTRMCTCIHLFVLILDHLFNY